jgi:hypothetical protein
VAVRSIGGDEEVVLRTVAGLFLIAHGIVTGAIWIPPQRGEDLPGFGSQASWLFAESRTTMVALGGVASAAFVVAGVGVLAHQDWWAGLGALGAVVSLALIVATFTPWWIFAVVINVAVLYAAWATLS